MIFELIAYTKTGKDTLVKTLNSRKNNFESWLVYSQSEDWPDKRDWIRLALADALKREVCMKHKISYEEDKKDIKNIILDGKIISFRDLCIKVGKETGDKQKWSKMILEQIDPNKNYIITDLRFKHEIDCLHDYWEKNHIEYKTVRLFNSNVQIPPSNIISEHELDEFKTDFLLVKKEEDIQKFSQYHDFVQKFYF